MIQKAKTTKNVAQINTLFHFGKIKKGLDLSFSKQGNRLYLLVEKPY